MDYRRQAEGISSIWIENGFENTLDTIAESGTRSRIHLQRICRVQENMFIMSWSLPSIAGGLAGCILASIVPFLDFMLIVPTA
jgi:uncharacterized protein (DUF2062 family)